MDDYLRPVKRRRMVQQWIERGEVAADFDEQSLHLSALIWFEQEREHLLGAIEWAKGRERWDTVISLAANLGLFFQARSYWQEWEKTCLMAVTAAQEVNDRHGEGKALNNLGVVYDSQSRWGEAIDCFQQSLTMCRELGDLYGEAQSLGNLGLVYKQQDRLDLAIPLWQVALTKFPEGSADYLILKRLLETDRHPQTKASKQPILRLIMGASVAILLLVNMISGYWIVAVVILGLAIGFWLLLRLWRKRSR
jgi:tetratricopeptide (TPR) repeat protein